MNMDPLAAYEAQIDAVAEMHAAKKVGDHAKIAAKEEEIRALAAVVADAILTAKNPAALLAQINEIGARRSFPRPGTLRSN